MEYDALRFWFDVVQVAGTVAIGIYVWLANRQRVTTQSIRALEQDVDERLDDHGTRLTRLEEEVRHLPTHDDIGGVFKRIDQIHGDLKELTGAMSGVKRAVDLINEHLLNGGRRRDD